MISIKAFRAIDNPSSCEKYIEGHRRLLESYGVAEIVGSNYDWVQNSGTYVIIVENMETGKTLGGTRIQLKSDKFPLPLEDAVGKMDDKVYDLVNEYAKNGTAEFCGLWNSKEVAGMGIGSIFLVRAGVARAGVVIAKALNIQSLFALCASYTFPIARKAGFIVESSVGDKGCFPYPKGKFTAIVAVNKDLEKLSYATAFERQEITDLKNNPVQTRVEKGPRGETKVFYDLMINSLELHKI
ncbi:MAG: hypothetical protein COX70_08720 [Flavobacteriales bacterium CG_4_10_14_0_2_um_filter_32_8]|nr:MAG: hypothetical protein COX70_08720 [Flavobacteriales bacterium CG_4_10_14_0_2_um_filter_32_8]PJB15684.1 MAG: hypothetical protein CO118_02590 [Flavobacteriales bacterium CG_4_9_14_3_um_filter_32_8]